MNCTRCEKEFGNYSKTKTRDACINYILVKNLFCEWCNGIYTRTKAHGVNPAITSFRCISRHGEIYF